MSTTSLGRAVTIVITTRDRRDLLADAIASALEQTGADVEVVVVDDGSTDGTADYLAGHGDPRVRTTRFDHRRERTVARNAGLREVSTPYVLFLDDDDQLAPGALASLVDGLEVHSKAPVAAGTYETFGTFGPEEVPRRQPIGRWSVRRRIFREVLWGWYLLPGAGLWRTDALRALGGWDESRNFAEDMELALRTHPAPVAVVPLVVLRYRQHGRLPDRSAEASHERMNDEVRARFLDQLVGSDRRAARRVVRARPYFARGVAAYGTGQYTTAVAGLVLGLVRSPSLAVSPILGPTLLGMVGKSLAALAVPTGLRQRVRQRRERVRAQRFGAGS